MPAPAAVLRGGLDAVIAAAALALVSVLLAGGFDLGVVRATSAAKPSLLLVFLIPVRLALGGQSWLTHAWRPCVEAVGAVPWRLHAPPAVRDALFALLVTRAAALAAAFVANLLLLRDQARPFALHLPWQKLSETLAVFDSAWYLDIARRGYVFDPSAQSSIAFFPLYPLLIRALAAPFGGSDTALWAAGVAISWTAFAAALIALHRLTERMTGQRDVARRTVLYLAVFPFSFYYSLVYTEALFLLCTVCAVSAGVGGRWWRAGLFGALAAATRPNGVLILVPLALMALGAQVPWRARVRHLLALAPAGLAVVAFSLYVATLAGHPLAWLDAQTHWEYSIGHAPYRHLLVAFDAIETHGLYGWLAGSATAPIDFAYTLVALLFLALVPAVARRFGLPLAAYVVISLAIPLSGNVLVGIGRYASVLFPVFMVAATASSERLQQAILVVSALFLTLFLILFVGWQPLH